MTTIEKAQLSAQALESVLISGDLSKLSPTDRMDYYQAVCASLGLKAATGQLRAKHQVSIVITNKEMVDNIYVVTAMATMPDGRTDTDDGAVAVAGLQGEAHANALMKTVTKAKRRVTLSISGLGCPRLADRTIVLRRRLKGSHLSRWLLGQVRTEMTPT